MNIYGSETASSINSRGVYKPSLYDRQLTAYDESRVNWGHLASDAWYTTIQKDFVAGEFVWTGFDYIGEPTNWNGITSGAQGAWPSPKNSYFGIIDTAGLRRKSKIKEELERYSIIRTVTAVERADVVLMVIDAVEGVTEQELRSRGLPTNVGKV